MSANENRRSEAIHRFDKDRRSSTGLGSNPTSSGLVSPSYGTVLSSDALTEAIVVLSPSYGQGCRLH
jgi:hypothetical protein